jgi:hypothetical protein
MIEAIWQWHLDAGGNLQGFIVGFGATIIMGGILLTYLIAPRNKNEISDEDFFSIVADEPTVEDIHKAMDKDDDYS